MPQEKILPRTYYRHNTNTMAMDMDHGDWRRRLLRRRDADAASLNLLIASPTIVL